MDAKFKSGCIFNENLSSVLIVDNIPRNKFQTLKSKNFLEKYTGKHIPYVNILRENYFGPCYVKAFFEIRKVISNADIEITVDEITD